MRTHNLSFLTLVTSLMITLPAAAGGIEKADVEKAVSAARQAQAKAASVGGEWRDVGGLLEHAEKAAKDGDYAEAVKLAEMSERQSKLGYEQAMSQQDADLPEYMIAGTDKQPVAHAVEASSGNKISQDIGALEIVHDGKKILIERDHDSSAALAEELLRTKRGCPPFCLQPMVAAEGVATLGELEVLDYIGRSAAGDTSILLVDSRTPDWVLRGTIPSAVNIPWTRLGEDSKAGTFAQGGSSAIDKILEETFGAEKAENGWDFSHAKTLILFCNGLWCGQSSNNIETLLDFGYPADRLKWYRGGMQDWVNAGLTIVRPR